MHTTPASDRSATGDIYHGSDHLESKQPTMTRPPPPPDSNHKARPALLELVPENDDGAFDPDVTVKLTLRRESIHWRSKLPVLRVVAGRDLLNLIPLRQGKTYTIGRDESADLTLMDPSVSRHHATVHHPKKDVFIIEDNGSTNGTNINGQAIRWSAFHPGDHLEIGTVSLRLDLMSEEEVAHHDKVRHRLLHAHGQDPLTGLRTRIFLEDDLPLLVRNCRDTHIPLSCAFLDIDHFKRVNDTLGHQAGDEVLQAVARLAMLDCRDTDICVRFGGEEFILFLLGTDEAGAMELARRLDRTIEEHDWRRTRVKLRSVTASIGVAELAQGESIESWVQRADQAMYAAKHQGRNTVVAASTLL